MSEEKKVRLLIRPAHFVPNVADRFNNNGRVHEVGYGKCNFRCEFCSFGHWAVEDYPEYTLESFEKKVWELLRYSKNFRFAGGEPTLNPYLADLLRIVKIYGSQVFLETNGSRPDIIKELLDEKLVDIVGLSLKGLNREEATATANIKKSELCWENVIETMDIVSQHKDATLVVTYVACDGYFKEEDLDTLGELLSPYPDVTYKINNCYDDNRGDKKRVGLDKSEIYKMVERFVERHPEYKGRTVLFREHDCCFDSSKIALF